MTKKFDVKMLLDEANRLLALEDNSIVNAHWRTGVTALLEYVLHETNNYHGFDYRGFVGEETKRFYYI